MTNSTQLVYFLAALYYREEEIYDIIIKAGFRNELPFIRWSSKATIVWTNIVEHLIQKNKLKQLIQAVLDNGHQENEYLIAVLNNEETDFNSPYSRSKLDKPVSATNKQLEKLTQGISTLLPISFLEKGIVKSKAVVRIVTGRSLGTGFIIQNKYLLTNNHVIGDTDAAITAKIQLNYEESIEGNMRNYITRRLDPLSVNGFETSKENDWTIVKLKDYTALDEQEYGFINLEQLKISDNEFVNIIQHPSGEAKKIALYHNLVISLDQERIQYLTDTLPGSSGSPVFNSDWQVVALHHAGGEVNVIGESVRQIVNEGININLVIKEVRARGLRI